jgi:hypothetical protein
LLGFAGDDAIAEIAVAARGAGWLARDLAEAVDALVFFADQLALALPEIASAARVARGIALRQAKLLPVVFEAIDPRALGHAAPALAGAARTTPRRSALGLALALLAALAGAARLLALGRGIVVSDAQHDADASHETERRTPGAQGLDEVSEPLAVHRWLLRVRGRTRRDAEDGPYAGQT